MTDGALHFMEFDPQLLRLSVPMAEAMQKWFAHRYPHGKVSRAIAADVGVDVRTADNILLGHLSANTLTRLLAAYGWDFLAGVGAAVIGETYEQFIHREIEEIANDRRQLEEREQSLRGAYARVRARSSVDGGGLRLVGEEDGGPDRQDRRARRGVGAEATGGGE